MSATAVIELVDTGILGVHGERRVSEPGYAALGPGGVATGESARARAWLEPQRCFNRFWHQLSLSPLARPNDHARHHADLAFAQLQAIRRELGDPDEILFAVPGSFSRDQLSILLGLAAALPARATGLVDAAVAATSTLTGSGDWLFLDLQLHQAVITHLRAGERLERVAVEAVPGAGLAALEAGWARHIAAQFVRDYRYDPLHSAEEEQQLYDLLPGWLAALRSHPETPVEMNTARGQFRFSLSRAELLDAAAARLGDIESALARFPSGQILCSHRVAALPGLAQRLGAEALAEDSAIHGCLESLEQVRSEAEALDFVTVLTRSAAARSAAAPPASGEPARPSHLLHGHRAWSLNEPLGIHPDTSGLRLNRDTQAPLLVRLGEGGVILEDRTPQGLLGGGKRPLVSGEVLTLGGEQLWLIEVEPGG